MMKKLLCHYAIVRFLPYVETGEFANVGIVLMCPETGYFNFRMLTHTGRITAFFDELDAGIYRRARDDFRTELKRVQHYFSRGQFNDNVGQALAKQVFDELTRPREVMMRFDDPRVLLTDDPSQQLEDLFAHYVERNFATKAYQERLLDKAVHKLLLNAKLGKEYQPRTLGDQAVFHARFPFVKTRDDIPLKAIKPLHLAHEDPTLIFEHGWAWKGKLEKLRALHLLPEQVLLPVQGPADRNSIRFHTFKEITAQLAANDVVVVEADSTDDILAFARP
jgi:plasmid stabilization system protein ParE